MASVFKAFDTQNERVVAVKILEPLMGYEEDFRVRFRREAEVLIGLRHPNIVSILDYGEDDGLAYIVMPFMNVGSLRERMLNGPLSPREGSRVIQQMASALDMAHKAGIIHRDVKPSNILIDEECNAWLSDFGTAHVHDASMSLTGSALIGTPQYMAPEQVRGEEVSPKTDQYSLAVILYQMCTGRLPYEAETPMGIILKHATEPLPRPRFVNPNLPDTIEEVLIKALAKDPENRYEDVMTMSKAFDAALSAVYDEESGKLRPGAVGAPPVEETTGSNGSNGDEDDGAEAEPPSRKPYWLILILALSAIALWGVWRLAFGPKATPPSGPTENFPATVQALYTSVAMGIGADMPIEQVQTAVAGTLQAMGVATPTAVGDSPPQIDYGVLSTSTTEHEDPVSATQTAALAAITASPTPSRTATRTPTLTDSSTQAPTGTFTVSPTPTRTFTPTRTNTPTRTAVPPTDTPPPPPTPTTPPSATPSPTEDVCALISLGGFSNPSEARWTITNDSGGTIRLTRVRLTDWPADNDPLFSISLKGDAIWSGEIESPPADISSGWIGGPSNRDVGESAAISFFFGMQAENSPYDVRLTFDNGCVVRDQR
jgi:serine/threonine-protein kinase